MPVDSDRQGLTTLTHVMYALHTASWFSGGIFSVIAMIINYVKRPDLPDEFFRSHFRWQARSLLVHAALAGADVARSSCCSSFRASSPTP